MGIFNFLKEYAIPILIIFFLKFSKDIDHNSPPYPSLFKLTSNATKGIQNIRYIFFDIGSDTKLVN